MSTKRTKTENLKTQVENLIESAQHTDTRSWRGDTREVYTMQGAGTFTAEYEIRPTGWTREEMEEELRRRARRIAARRMLPKGMDDRSTRLQRAMLYISQHREMIPFLTHVSTHASADLKDMTDVIDAYCATHGRPTFVHRDWNNYRRTHFYTFAPKGIEESDLLGQVPYIPRAWRA